MVAQTQGIIPLVQHEINGTRMIILLDNCSTSCFITNQAAQKINGQKTGKSSIKLSTLGQTKQMTTQVINFEMKLKNNTVLRIAAKVIPKILPSIKTRDYNKTANICSQAGLKVPHYDEEEIQVDIMLGQRETNLCTGTKVWKMQDKKIEVRDSCFGLFVQGKPKEESNHNEESSHNIAMITNTLTRSEAEKIEVLQDEQLSAYVDRALNVGTKEFPRKDDDEPNREELWKRFKASIKRETDEDGKTFYTAAIPWISEDARLKVPRNEKLARAFMKSNLLKLEKMKKLEEFNKKCWHDLIDQGIFEEVNLSDPKEADIHRTFLASFPVFSDSTSTSIRLVIAANLPRGNNLNQQMSDQLNFLLPLPKLVHRWKIHKVAVTSDIARAFYQIRLRECDKPSFSLMWYKDPEVSSKNPESQREVQVVQLGRLPMGGASSSGILGGVMTVHLDEDVDKIAAKELKDSIYVDNGVTSLNVADPLDLVLRMVEVLARGGFELKKFSTNDERLRQQLIDRGLYNEKEMETTKVLGSIWHLHTDECSIAQIEFDEKTVWTKRLILAAAHSTFDSQGVFCAVTIKATDFFTRHCLQYNWDQPLEQHLVDEWKPILLELKGLASIRLPRWYGFNTEEEVKMNISCDAASSKYIAALCHLEQGGRSVLVAGKAKLPAKNLRGEDPDTTPKMELDACIVAAKMMVQLKDALQDHYQLRIRIYSDSQIALHWLTSRSTHTRFVANRVTRFHELVGEEATLHFLEGQSNPADYASRSLSLDEIKDLEHPYWKGAPAEVLDSEPFQGKTRSTGDGEIVLATMEEEKPSVLKLIDPEGKTLEQYTKILTNVIRIVRKWQKKPELSERKLSKLAANRILRAEQEHTVPGIIEYLERNRGPKHAWISPMRLWLDQGIEGGERLVRLGGRLSHSGLGFAAKYPILYSKDSPLYDMRVRAYHLKGQHCGVTSVRNQMQRELWTPNQGKSIRKVLKTCYECLKSTGKPLRLPQSPDLPASRVIPESYRVVGVDFTSHFFVKEGKETVKVYILFIICLASRHFSAYVMKEMTTEAFLHAFRRHCGVMGSPFQVRSDRAANFIRAKHVLSEQAGEAFLNEIAEKLGKRGCEWLPTASALSPWMGAAWERGIGILKNSLRRCIGRNLLSYDEFVTTVTECVCICNDRILAVDNPSDSRDRLAITPSHLVFGHPLNPLPYGQGNLETLDDPNYIPEERELNRVWKKVARRLEIFKKQFCEEWLESLRKRHQYDHQDGPVEPVEIGEGDLVLVYMPNTKRSLWDMGIVHRIIPSVDNQIRSLELKNAKGEIISRPVNKVYPLVKAEQLKGPRERSQPRDPQANGLINTTMGVDQQQNAPITRRPPRKAKTVARERLTRVLDHEEEDD